MAEDQPIPADELEAIGREMQRSNSSEFLAHPLSISLSMSVPLKILTWQGEGRGPEAHDWERCKAFGQLMLDDPGYSEGLLFKIKGKSAHAYNELSHIVACMAYLPGGITIFGLHFEAQPGWEIRQLHLGSRADRGVPHREHTEGHAFRIDLGKKPRDNTSYTP